MIAVRLISVEMQIRVCTKTSQGYVLTLDVIFTRVYNPWYILFWHLAWLTDLLTLMYFCYVMLQGFDDEQITCKT